MIPNYSRSIQNPTYYFQKNHHIASLVPDLEEYQILNGLYLDSIQDDEVNRIVWVIDPSGVPVYETEEYKESIFFFATGNYFHYDSEHLLNSNLTIPDSAYSFSVAQSILLNCLYEYRAWLEYIKAKNLETQQDLESQQEYLDWYKDNDLGEFPYRTLFLSTFIAKVSANDTLIDNLWADNEANISAALGLADPNPGGKSSVITLRSLLPNQESEWQYRLLINQLSDSVKVGPAFNDYLYFNPFKTGNSGRWYERFTYQSLVPPQLYYFRSYEGGLKTTFREEFSSRGPWLSVSRDAPSSLNYDTYLQYLKWDGTNDPHRLTNTKFIGFDPYRIQVNDADPWRSIHTTGLYVGPDRFGNYGTVPIARDSWVPEPAAPFAVAVLGAASTSYQSGWNSNDINLRKSEEFDYILQDSSSEQDLKQVFNSCGHPQSELLIYREEENPELDAYPNYNYHVEYLSSHVDRETYRPYSSDFAINKEPRNPVPNTSGLGWYPFQGNANTHLDAAPGLYVSNTVGVNNGVTSPSEPKIALNTAVQGTTARGKGAHTDGKYRRGWNCTIDTTGLPPYSYSRDVTSYDPIRVGPPVSLVTYDIYHGTTYYNYSVSTEIIYEVTGDLWFGQDIPLNENWPAWLVRVTEDIDMENTIYWDVINDPFGAQDSYLETRVTRKDETRYHYFFWTGDPVHFQTLDFTTVSPYQTILNTYDDLDWGPSSSIYANEKEEKYNYFWRPFYEPGVTLIDFWEQVETTYGGASSTITPPINNPTPLTNQQAIDTFLYRGQSNIRWIGQIVPGYQRLDPANYIRNATLENAISNNLNFDWEFRLHTNYPITVGTGQVEPLNDFTPLISVTFNTTSGIT